MIAGVATVRLGIKSLLLHKLRSGLAMLGIVIGVTAVIWLVALGEGVSYQAQQQIKDLGATNVILKSVKPTESASSGGNTPFIIKYGLTRDDFDRIVSTIPTVRRAVPMREAKSQAWAGTRMSEIQLLGCTADYREINHLVMARGRFISDSDEAKGDNVCVLAAEATERLFAYEDPIGNSIQILSNQQSDIYRVIGVTESRSPSASIGGALEGRNYNRDVYIPMSSFRQRIGDMIIQSGSGSRSAEEIQISQITVTVDNIEQVEETAAIVEILLDKFHKDADFAVVVPKELLRQAETLRRMFNVLLVIIAGISLLVGGIGIMNIMLATVTERTREIGVRRAMGATRGDIIRQFLVETMILSATGGLIGLVAGFLCPYAVYYTLWAIENWFPEMWSTLPPTIQGLEPIIAPWSIAAAVGISISVGVLFGLYPARRAALMDPIEALRHE
ncbi:MAG: ABC transporter permease [Planctomycetaceae bacterium]